MDLQALIRERYSCRDMDSNRPVEKEKLMKIAEAARWAPSACNLQRHRLKIVTSSEGLAKLRQCTPCHFSAPAVVILCLSEDTGNSQIESSSLELSCQDGALIDNSSENHVIWDRQSSYKFGMLDIGIVAAHMSLQAQELGLGNTIVGMFDEDKLRSFFGIPEGQIPVLLFPVGYSGEKGGPCILHKSRRPLEDTMEFI